MGNINYPSPSVVLDESGNNALKVTGSGSSAVVTIQGGLNVLGATTLVQSTTTQIDDKNIELAVVDSPTDVTADGGGITLKGTTDKTINWSTSNSNWTSSENWNIATGKVFQIADTEVLSATALGAGVTSSSLTAVGTIATGVWQGTAIVDAYIADDLTIASSSAIAATGSSASAPAFAFVGDTDTGMYSPSADTLRFATGGSHAATIASSGNIGIGTTSPTQVLHVDTSTDGEGILALNGATGAAFEAKWISGTGKGYQLKLDDNTNATSVFLRSYGDCYFNTGGNFGIGTVAPTTTLDVAGTLKVSGTTALNGVTYTWPASDGSSGNQLTTDGAGGLTWSASGAGGSGIANLVEDVSPQLGADLDCNGKILGTAGTGNGARVRWELYTATLSTTSTTISDQASVYLISASTSGATATIPSASTFSAGVQFVVKNSGGTNSFTLTTSGGSIDAAASGTGIELSPYESVTVVSDGTNFHLI